MKNKEYEEIYWKLLFKKMDKITGLDSNYYNQSFLKRRIKARLLAHDIENISDYLHIIEMDPEEMDHLLKELSIHVTNFFRNQDTFHVFIAETLMEFCKKKEENKTKLIKIWSAGCSSGEEPYSIAMILLELLQDILYGIKFPPMSGTFFSNLF